MQGWKEGWEKPLSKIEGSKRMKGVTFWNALWQGAARVQAEGFHPGLDASWDALEVELN